MQLSKNVITIIKTVSLHLTAVQNSGVDQSKSMHVPTAVSYVWLNTNYT